MSDTESLHIQTSKQPVSSFDAMAHQPQFGDTTFTKLFVGGLAWETPTEEMHKYFEQFGDILEAVIITDKNTGKSKGYGFVTFSDEESARRACADPNPVIDGRRANCNIASVGRTRPSPPRGKDGGGRGQGGGASYGGGVPAAGPPSLAQALPLLYPSYSYGYQTYTPDYGYHQQGTMYNPQLQQAQYYHQQQIYGTSSSAMGSPYYYGYSSHVHVQAPIRSTFSYSPQPNQLSAAAAGPPSYLYYPTTVPMDVSFSGTGHRPPQQPPIRQPFPSPCDPQTQQLTSSESTAGEIQEVQTPKG